MDASELGEMSNREESTETTEENTTKQKPPITTGTPAAAKNDHDGEEYLINIVPGASGAELEKIGIASIRRKYGALAASLQDADDVDNKETTESHPETILQSSKADKKGELHQNSRSAVSQKALRSILRVSRQLDREHGEFATLQEPQSTDDGSLHTSIDVDATEKRRQEQQLEKDNQEQKTKNGELAQASGNLTTNRRKTVSILDIVAERRTIPLSESSIRAADAVTVDMLDRAISDDLNNLTSCSLCQMAAMIVSRVLDSARYRVLREDRLPPATSWTGKARREAALLVEDVLSSAMIYVSRNGDAHYARPAVAGTSRRRVVDDVMDDDAAWQTQQQFKPEHLLYPVWAKEEEQDEVVQVQQPPSKPVSLDQADVQKDDADAKREHRQRMESMARISIIVQPSQLPKPEQEHAEAAKAAAVSDQRTPSQTELTTTELPPQQSSEKVAVEESEGAAKVSSSDLAPFSQTEREEVAKASLSEAQSFQHPEIGSSIFEHQTIARQLWSAELPSQKHSKTGLIDDKDSPTANETAHLQDDDLRATWQQLFGPRRRLSTTPSTPIVHKESRFENSVDHHPHHHDVDTDDKQNRAVDTDAEAIPERPTNWQQLFYRRGSTTDNT